MSGRQRPGGFDFGRRDDDAPARGRAGRGRARAALVVVLVIALVIAIAAALGAGAWWLWHHPEHLPAALRDAGIAPPPGETELYRWRDASGEVQITDRPPPPGTEYETLQYRHDVNVLPLAPREGE